MAPTELLQTSDHDTDPEDCVRCTESTDGLCEYHRGHAAGMEWVLSRLRVVASCPELISGVLP